MGKLIAIFLLTLSTHVDAIASIHLDAIASPEILSTNETLLAQPKHLTNASFSGFVTVDEGREVYVDLERPQRGAPTLVMLNGLTYSTEEWDSLVRALRQNSREIGLLRYDMHGMGKTFLKYVPNIYDIPHHQQVEDLKTLLQVVDLEGPVYIVGLSYGGGIALDFLAKHGSEIAGAIVMAPYLAPLEQQDTWVRSQIWLVRKTPGLKQLYQAYSDEELYDFFFRQIILTYPTAEPVILKEPYLLGLKLETIFRLAKGIRHWKAEDIVDRLPKHKLHLMVALEDQYIAPAIFKDFWDSLPENVKASRLIIKGSEHKIPEAIPDFAAQWLLRIVNKEPKLWQGNSFKGFVFEDRIEAFEEHGEKSP